MATRKVNTEFTVTGEEKLRRAITEINNGAKVLKSEMNKLTAEYDGNTDSAEFLTQKYDILERQMLTQKDKVEALKQAVADSAEAYGEADSKTQGWIIQLNNAEAALANTYGEMGRTQTAIEDMDGALDDVSGSTETASGGMESLGDVLDTVADKLGIKLPDSITKTADGLGSIPTSTAVAAGAFAAVLAVVVKLEKKLMDMTKEAADSAKNLVDMSSQTGISTENLQAFQYAEDFIGVSTDTIADSLKDLTTKMSDAANGNEDVIEKFDQLGVSIYDADGNLRNAEDTFWDVVDSLGEMSNQTERDALAMDLINESAQKLNPLIEIGSEGFKKYADEAENVGYILSNDQLKALTDVDEAQNRLLKSQEAVSKQISAQYAPYMSDALNETRELIEKVGTALIDSGAVDAFGSILDSAVSLLEPLGDLVSDLLPPLGVLLQGVAGTIAWIADTINLIVGLLTLNGDRISTALGLNPNKASNIQKALYGADYKTESYYDSTGNYYDPTTGQWTGNYFHNAGGNDNFPGGRTRVGENGPETVYLPQGTVIANAQETRADGGYDAPVNVYIEARTIQEFNDIIEIVRDAQRVRRMKGAPR
uniref:phage tail tape measure protein n=1 Tax=Candidatus Limivicinus sp. TaxID=3030905 RepID=UPI003FF0A2A6